MNKRIGKLSLGDKVANVIIYGVFGLFALLCVFPFYYILINSISNNDAVNKGDVMFWPIGPHLENYKKILEINDIGNAAINSLSRTVIGTVLSLLCTSFMGYAISRTELWHRKLWYRLITATMYFSAGLIPGYLLIRDLHLLNNFLVYVIPGLVSAYNLMLFKTFVESIPSSLEESADLDGAGYLVKYFKIILPLCKPILATLCIFTAVGHWNSFMDTAYYVTNPKLFTLQYILHSYLTEAQRVAQMIEDLSESGGSAAASMLMQNQMTSTTLKMSVAMVVTIPVLCIYPFFQKYFVGGIMIGAVKG